jgi:adenine deaminase
MMFEMARRNGVALPYATEAEVRGAYSFSSLQSFLDIYYRAAEILVTPTDFYELMAAYLDRAAADGVRHAEIFFDPQTHTTRGVGFEVFMEGLTQAIEDRSKAHGITAGLILCFVRHLTPEDAVVTLAEAEPYLDKVIGVGLDSSEVDRPPWLFEEVFERARRLGLRAVAHAGEEGPPEYISAALDVLGAERIDHGVRSMEDPDLVDRLARERVPLTVCPISNVALAVVPDLADHPLPAMMSAGLLACVNSDDPAFFGGYVAENYRRAGAEMGLADHDLLRLAANSIEASFMTTDAKQSLLTELARAQRGTIAN